MTYPEGKKISVPFTRTDIAPKAATLEGTLRMEKGQVDIKLAWKMMEPAVMFAGNITSYNVWAITADGRPENLGELQVREKKSGEGSFRTGKVTFAIMVTADVLPGTIIPSELVIFTSGRSTRRRRRARSSRSRPPVPSGSSPGPATRRSPA